MIPNSIVARLLGLIKFGDTPGGGASAGLSSIASLCVGVIAVKRTKGKGGARRYGSYLYQ